MLLAVEGQGVDRGGKLRLEAMPDVVRLRTRVSYFFVGLLWAHVPLVAAMAVHNGTNVAIQFSLAMAFAAIASLAVFVDASGPTTRLLVSLALTAMPVLIVYNGVGPWQIDYHMYFFAIFAMLVAYCDWRPIVAAATVTAVHHYVFDILDPVRVFPTEGGIARVLLHAGIVAVECGVLIWITFQLRRLFHDFAIARQVAERAEARATEHVKELEATNSELESFAYTVAHDLRAPLRAIDGFSTALNEDLAGTLPADAAHSLDRISANARQLGRLIDALLNFSRLGTQKLVREKLAPKAVAEQALRRIRTSNAEPRADITMSDMPPCSADPDLLCVVYQNLLDNAMKFTRDRENAKIEVGWEPAADAPTIPVYYVRDNGAGFDMRYKDKLFGVFSRLHRADQFPGTGAGLATVKRIVTKHGGKIWGEATPGEGATFFFTLEPGL